MEFCPPPLFSVSVLCCCGRGLGPARAERRRGLPCAVCLECRDEEGVDPLSLETAGLHDGEDSFREAGSPLTTGAEAPLPPEDPPPQNALGMVVRGLDPFAAKEGPESGLQVQEVLAKGCRLIIREPRTAFQEYLEILPNPSHRMLESGSVYSSRLEVIPDREEVTRKLLEFVSDFGRLASPIDQLLKVTDQMRPANLAEPQGTDAVGLPAIAGEDPAVDAPQESLEPSEPTVRMDHEVSHHGGASGPHPDRLVAIFPARLVEILGFSLSYRFGSLLVRGLQGLSYLGLHVRDRAKRNGNSHDVLEDLLDLASRHLVATAEEGAQGSQPGAEGRTGYFLGDLCMGHVTAPTGPRKGLVLGNLVGYLWKIRDLVPKRWLGIRSRNGKWSVALFAGLRDVSDEVVHLIGRKKATLLSFVADLASRVSSAGRLGISLRSVRGVAGWRPVGVPRILPEPFLEGLDLLVRLLQHRLESCHKAFQLSDPLCQLCTVRAGAARDSRALHFLHVDVIGSGSGGLYGNLPGQTYITCTERRPLSASLGPQSTGKTIRIAKEQPFESSAGERLRLFFTLITL